MYDFCNSIFLVNDEQPKPESRDKVTECMCLYMISTSTCLYVNIHENDAVQAWQQTMQMQGEEKEGIPVVGVGTVGEKLLKNCDRLLNLRNEVVSRNIHQLKG